MFKNVKAFQYLVPKLSFLMICSLCLLMFFPTLAISEEKLEVAEKKGQKEVQEEIAKKDWTDIFEAQIKQWISDISKQDPQFQNWTSAKWESYPFGPGSKQWMILLIKEKKEIGYLIIGVDSSDQLVLVEYGQSRNEILSQAIHDPKGGFFYSGLLWAHIDDGVLVDAITLERYDHVPLEKVTPLWLGEAVHKIQQVYQYHGETDEENPIVHYNPISDQSNIEGNTLTMESEIKDQVKNINAFVQRTKKNQPLFFQAEILPQVRGLYEVETIHQWTLFSQKHEPTEAFYIGLNDGGVRFLSYEYLKSINGDFY